MACDDALMTAPTMSEKPNSARAFYIPAIVFFVIAGIMAMMLTREGRDVAALPSALIGQLAPQTSLPAIAEITRADGTAMPGIEPSLFEDKITLVNVWASWCAPCREEHPFLMALSEDPRLQIIGLNQRDRPANAAQFLKDLGNPYDAVGADSNGRASIEWGVYGVPETFLVGPEGIIHYKHTGPFNADIIVRALMPEIEKLASALQ